MRLLLEYNEFADRESITRTKSLNEEEFLQVLKENCKNFSFDNDLLWRRTDSNFGQFGIFFSKERKNTIGVYRYKDFFDDRKDYPVPRYKSLIGSTTKKGADYFGVSGNKTYIVIPFDNTNIIFSCFPDIALMAKRGQQEFQDWMFLLKQYEPGFKIPVDELNDIFSKTDIYDFKDIFDKNNCGFEFFTNGNCLLLDVEKIEWLKNKI